MSNWKQCLKCNRTMVDHNDGNGFLCAECDKEKILSIIEQNKYNEPYKKFPMKNKDKIIRKGEQEGIYLCKETENIYEVSIGRFTLTEEGEKFLNKYANYDRGTSFVIFEESV